MIILISVPQVLRFSFIATALLSLLAALIFRLMKKRHVADILELFAAGFFFAYTIPFLVQFKYFNADSYTNLENWSQIIIFTLALTLAIYKIIFFVRGK